MNDEREVLELQHQVTVLTGQLMTKQQEVQLLKTETSSLRCSAEQLKARSAELESEVIDDFLQRDDETDVEKAYNNAAGAAAADKAAAGFAHAGGNSMRRRAVQLSSKSMRAKPVVVNDWGDSKVGKITKELDKIGLQTGFLLK